MAGIAYYGVILMSTELLQLPDVCYGLLSNSYNNCNKDTRIANYKLVALIYIARSEQLSI